MSLDRVVQWQSRHEKPQGIWIIVEQGHDINDRDTDRSDGAQDEVATPQPTQSIHSGEITFARWQVDEDKVTPPGVAQRFRRLKDFGKTLDLEGPLVVACTNASGPLQKVADDMPDVI